MKDMLTKNDLKQIGELLESKLEEKLETKLEEKLESKLDSKLAEVLEAVNTGFSDMQTDIDGLKRKVTKIEAAMVTKDYLDERITPINGKINVLVDVLHGNGTISDDQRRIVHT